MFKIILITMILVGDGIDQKREVIGVVPASQITEGLKLCEILKDQREFTDFNEGPVVRTCEHAPVTVKEVETSQPE